MFGYYALRCSVANNFWVNLNPNALYWKLFFDFVSEMKKIELEFVSSDFDIKIPFNDKINKKKTHKRSNFIKKFRL